VILESITGDKSVAQACNELGIGESMLFELRAQALQAAASRLEPGRPGRPPERSEEEAERMELEAELKATRLELQAARVREEIALIMPGRRGKKNDPKR